MRHALPRLALLAGAALLSLSAHAHRPWLLPSATLVDGPAPVVSVDAAISEDLFEFDSFPLMLDSLRVTAPDGSAVAPAARVEARRRVSFDLQLAQKGTYRIAGVTDTAMASWKAGGETKRWRGSPAALAAAVPADAQDLQVTRQLARAETFVTNEAPSALPAAVTGEGLELQPLTNPTDLSVGDASRFRVLLDGKPFAGADVTLIRGGNRYRYRMGEIALKTDAAGEFGLAWPEAGRYWLGINHGGRPQGVAGTPPPAGGAPARRESYSATFEVLPK
ncbi:MAG TPA: DUF4198 domain-containing protein [Burkholderiaceae bacterium]|nr:DUF4198 domain-containing protein [Burkholderiaceae bacterium]